MRLLNLRRPSEEGSGSADQPVDAAYPPCRAIRFGGARVFLDPATLSAWAAGGPDERAPVSSGPEPEFPPSGRPRVRAVVLSVTHGCNLACRYCYVRKKQAGGGRREARGRALRPSASSPQPASSMSRETARKALDLLEPPGPWRVGFFGGEPLLAWDLVREVTELARARADRLGTRVRFSVTTNGTLLDYERARFLAARGFSIILSLDGPKELHDRERVFAASRDPAGDTLRAAKSTFPRGPLRPARGIRPATPARCPRLQSGRGSFERVRRGLDAAAAAGLGARTTLRATFPLARPALAERLEFLNGLADAGFARAVSVEPAWPAPSETGEGVRLGALPGEYLSAARWAVARLEAGRRVRYHHLEKALERVLLRRPAGTECGAGFGYVEVAPSGEIYPCHKETGGPIGHVDSGVSERLRAPWRENRRYARRGCDRCWARNVCGGGCRAESIEHTRDIARPWPVECAAKRLQVRAALYVAASAPRGALEKMFERELHRTRGAARALRPAT